MANETTSRPGFGHVVGEIEGAALRQALSTLGLDANLVVKFLVDGSQPTLAHLTLAYSRLTLDRAQALSDGLSPSTVDELVNALDRLRIGEGKIKS